MLFLRGFQIQRLSRKLRVVIPFSAILVFQIFPHAWAEDGDHLGKEERNSPKESIVRKCGSGQMQTFPQLFGLPGESIREKIVEEATRTADAVSQFEAIWLAGQKSDNPPSISRVDLLKSALPEFQVTPATGGLQLVRVSLPFAPGVLTNQIRFLVHGETTSVTPDVRILTIHPGWPRMVRRAILSFPYCFQGTQTVHFRLESLHPFSMPSSKTPPVTEIASGFQIRYGSRIVSVTEAGVRVSQASQTLWYAKLISPVLHSSTPPSVVRVESGKYFSWVLLNVPDPEWPRLTSGQIAWEQSQPRFFSSEWG